MNRMTGGGNDMIVHNLLIKLHDRSGESCAKARDLLLTLKGNVEVIRDLEVGVDIRRAESSYDVALIAKFATKEDYQAYLVHPFHVEVGNQLKSTIAAAASVCFEEQ
jgi:Stress responsive A/B Barrel Domain